MFKSIPDTVECKEYSSFVLLGELDPEGNGQALLTTGEEWYDLRSAAAGGVSEVEIVVDLDS